MAEITCGGGEGRRRRAEFGEDGEAVAEQPGDQQGNERADQQDIRRQRAVEQQPEQQQQRENDREAARPGGVVGFRPGFHTGHVGLGPVVVDARSRRPLVYSRIPMHKGRRNFSVGIIHPRVGSLALDEGGHLRRRHRPGE